MDTLSAASVSTFKIPTAALHPKSHELHLFNHRLSQQQFTKQINSNKLASSKNFNNPPSLNSSSQPTTFKTPQQQSFKLQQTHHQNSSTGYAVSLLDAARCHHALESVSRDVRRLSRWLRNEEINGLISDPCVGKKEKGEMFREIVKRGKFHKYLSRLVNLLVEKSNGEVEMVREVLMEFGRIYDELAMMSGSDCATAADDQVVVLVSTGVKMEINQVLGVAKRVQKISGAAKVTLRQPLVVDGLYSSFAV